MKKVLIIIGVIVLVVGALVIYVFLDVNSAHEPTFLIKELKSNSLEEKIYLKRKNWGITADNDVYVLSASSEKEFGIDSTQDFIFHSEFYYKIVNDSLMIYTALKANKPKGYNSKWKIVQFELQNNELMDLRGYNNYKKQGLELSSDIR